MNTATFVMVVAATLGSALVGGIFFAFSNFVMPALARVPATAGMQAMQSVNVVVLNRGFLALFVGTAILFIGLVVLGLLQWTTPHGPYIVGAAAAYLAGTWGVTIAGNVPLNDQLARAVPGDQAAEQLWSHYLERWTRLNTQRTGAAILAALLLLLSLMH